MKKTTEKPNEMVDIVKRTGNVFAQLGRPDADDLLRKSRVLSVINEVIEERGWTQMQAAEHLGIDQADVSRLSNGKLGRFSLDRLMEIAGRLQVELNFKQRHDADGHLVVEVTRTEELAYA